MTKTGKSDSTPVTQVTLTVGQERADLHDISVATYTKISNLLINVFYAAPCLEKMLELGRRGITMYYVPSPKKYKF